MSHGRGAHLAIAQFARGRGPDDLLGADHDLAAKRAQRRPRLGRLRLGSAAPLSTLNLEVIDAASPNFDARIRPPDMVVLHYTGMESGEAALARLRDPEANTQESFPTLTAALARLGQVEEWPIAVDSQLRSDEEWQVRLRAGVRRGHMPDALRALMFWTDGWHRTSDWYSWTLVR